MKETNKTVFGVHNHNNIIFLSLEAAEDYVIEKYPEFCCGKDATYDFCERMIWEDSISKCGDCNQSIITSDILTDSWCHHERAGL